ncbi:hypothetical protein JW752_01185 [Candidatus Peregrinibacteria bacterium]|nr:hypothetical protein [Candidatus Peregrinibacteria bacterium]
MANCKNCNTGFEFTEADKKVHEKMNVPPPALCPDCRQQRRIAFRNDSNYYRNACHLCKKPVVSIYSPDKPLKVLCPDCFWRDKWDPLEYGQDFDFNRPFFEQYAEMRAKVPRLAIFNTQSENSEFTVHSSKNRNCYMGSSLVDSEDVHYSDWAFNSRDCMDLLFCSRMEMCYECVDCQECTLSNYLELCSNVTESFFAFDCRGCKGVVGCVSMRNRKNHILNQPASKEECMKTIQKLKTDRKFFQEFKEKFEALKARLPKRESWFTNAENCSGNYIVDSKNARHAYNIKYVEDARYVYDSHALKDCFDVTRIGGGEMLYDCKAGVDLSFAKFCNLVYQSDNTAYCDNCHASHYCFGCMSLKREQFCVLNKKYSEADYKKLVPKIIDHMKKTEEYGEFFPVELSAFGYNETKAMEFFPMNKKEVLKKGWNWSDYEVPSPKNIKTISADKLPDDIKAVPDDILNWAIICEATGKPFKIIPQELKFYRTKGLPVPKRYPRQRHLDRVAHQNPRKLYDRKCGNCQKPIRTTYAPDCPEKVYCEKCYLTTVY